MPRGAGKPGRQPAPLCAFADATGVRVLGTSSGSASKVRSPHRERSESDAYLALAAATNEVDVAVFLELLIAVAIVAALVRFIRIPYTIALVLVGLGFAFFPDAPRVVLTASVILTVFLPVLLFSVPTISTSPTCALTSPRLCCSPCPAWSSPAGLTGLALHFAVGLDWAVALLFGTIVAATDPVAVLAIFGEVGAPRRLSTIVTAESLFNDGTALVFFAAVLGVATGASVDVGTTLEQFVLGVAGSLALGTAVAIVGTAVLQRIDDALLETTITLIMAYGGYLLAAGLGASGPLETVTSFAPGRRHDNRVSRANRPGGDCPRDAAHAVLGLGGRLHRQAEGGSLEQRPARVDGLQEFDQRRASVGPRVRAPRRHVVTTDGGDRNARHALDPDPRSERSVVGFDFRHAVCGIPNEVNFVDCKRHVGDPEQRDGIRVAPGLREQAVRGVDQDHGAIGPRHAGDLGTPVRQYIAQPRDEGALSVAGACADREPERTLPDMACGSAGARCEVGHAAQATCASQRPPVRAGPPPCGCPATFSSPTRATDA